MSEVLARHVRTLSGLGSDAGGINEGCLHFFVREDFDDYIQILQSRNPYPLSRRNSSFKR